MNINIDKNFINNIQLLFNQNPPETNPEQIKIIKSKLEFVLTQLETGTISILDKKTNTINTWVKQAILLYFRYFSNNITQHGMQYFLDKVPLRFTELSDIKFLQEQQSRLVPPACVRRGAYIGKNCVLMPSYINIGAYVDDNTMIDTWATVGSCAQIGKNVHISGGAGIGGVLEPLQANPTVIEDDCFIGARSEIVEGVKVGQGSVISMGVFIGQSTKIYDRMSKKIYQGEVPSGSVIVPGSLPSLDGSYNLNCGVIVKYVDNHTRQKTAINEILRAYV